MHAWRLVLTAGLAVPGAASWLIDFGYRFYGKPATVSGANDPLLAQEDDGPLMLTINTSVHLVATSGDKLLSHEALDGQMDIINRSFAPHNISFYVIEVEYIINPLWGIGLDESHMLWNLNRGDARTLNLYFVERFDKYTDWLSYAHAPHLIASDPGAYKVNAVVVHTATVPNGPSWESALWQGKTAVESIGHWLGLLNTFVGGCRGEGDLVDDTPASIESASFGTCPQAVGLDSCPDRPGLDPIHNFMSSTNDSCKTEFTPGQGRRMHQMWNEFCAPHRAPTAPLLVEIAPLEQEGKLAYYSEPVSLTAALVQCSPDWNNVTSETRESYCGTFVYCYQGTWKAAGRNESYTGAGASWPRCASERALPPKAQEAGEQAVSAETDALGKRPKNSDTRGHVLMHFG